MAPMDQEELRKDLLFDILSCYITDYNESLLSNESWTIKQYKRDCANDWLFKKINEYYFTKDEVKEALKRVERATKSLGKPYEYDSELFSTKFFRR